MGAALSGCARPGPPELLTGWGAAWGDRAGLGLGKTSQRGAPGRAGGVSRLSRQRPCVRGRGFRKGQGRPQDTGVRGPAGGGRAGASGLAGCGPRSVHRTLEGRHIAAASSAGDSHPLPGNGQVPSR